MSRGSRILASTSTALAVGLLVGCGGSDHDDDDSGEQQVSAQQACDAVNGKTIAGATVTAAAVAASGAVPTYCRVSGNIAPSLNFEIRLPQSWNGKLRYGGGGGYNGVIPGVNLPALNMGYADVSSDSGHGGGNVFSADFARTDAYAAQLFGSLSTPTVMSSATEIIRTAYGRTPARSYFEGCSNGGREALMNVQRYPNLFDGVIARAPAYNWVGLMGHFNRTAKAVAATATSFTLAKTQLLAQGVRNACDGLDGIVDGVVSNQAACTPAVFDPASLRCPGGTDTGNTCLSDAQLAVVTSWTTDAVQTGSPTFRNAGWSLTGNEDDPGAWPAWVTGNGNVNNAAQFRFQDTTVKNYLARDPAVNSLTYTPFDQNQNALFAMSALNDATLVDIRPFRNSGGKLLLWHGGNDAALSKNATAEYYTNVTNAVGGAANVTEFVRFYIAPGVGHCAGGPGADTVDLLSALDAWVDRGTAPGTLTAEKRDTAGATLFSRPLCEYPRYPRYTGPANDVNAARQASNYTCSQ
jgi:feruloyl esterase